MEERIKIAIINGENSGYDGKIDYIKVDKEDFYHAYLLKKYIEENNYIVSDDVNMNDANSMSLFLREKGNVIFLDSTTYKDNKPGLHGKTGIVILPDNVTENQKEAIMNLNEEIEDFDSLQVWYNFSAHLECKMLIAQNNDQVRTILGDALDNINTKTR